MNLEVLIALKDRITAPLKRVKEKLASVTATSEKLKNTTIAPRVAKQSFADVDSLSNRLGGLKRMVATVFAAGAITAFAGSVTSTLAEFERYDAVLTNTLGSKSAAQQSLAQITDFAAKTPFAVDELTSSFVKLANQGFVPVENEMRQLGDLASSVGKPFDQLVEAVLDAQTGEFERLKEFGIKAKVAGDKVTFSFKGIKTEVQNSEGAIRAYMLGLGDLEGVSGSMAAIAETTGGQLSNLGDVMTQLKLEIGQGLKPVISATIEVMKGMVQVIRDVVAWAKEHVELVKSITYFVGILVTVFVAWKLAVIALNIWTAILNITLGTTALIVGSVVVVVAALAAGFYYAYQKSEKFRAMIAGIGGLLTALVDPVKYLGNMLANLFNPDEFAANFARFVSSVTSMDLKGAFNTAYDQSLAESKAVQEEKDKSLNPKAKDPAIIKGKQAIGQGITKVAGGGQAQRNITINIQSLVREMHNHYTKGKEAARDTEKELTEILIRAVRNAETAL